MQLLTLPACAQIVKAAYFITLNLYKITTFVWLFQVHNFVAGILTILYQIVKFFVGKFFSDTENIMLVGTKKRKSKPNLGKTWWTIWKPTIYHETSNKYNLFQLSSSMWARLHSYVSVCVELTINIAAFFDFRVHETGYSHDVLM